VRTLWGQRAEPLPDAGAAPEPVLLTPVAFAAVWAALVLPDTTVGLLGIPIEGLAFVAAALVLPGRLRRWSALGFGAVAGVLVVLSIVNHGFAEVLDRPFDPLGDWRYFGSGVGVLGDSIGDVGARLVAVGVVLLIGAVVVVLALAAGRVARVAHPRPEPRSARRRPLPGRQRG
jgi:hypothetical protein